MGAGTSCTRLDCVGSVEECTRQAEALGANRPKAFWLDCAGNQSQNAGTSSPKNGFEEALTLRKGQELDSEAQLSADSFAINHLSSSTPTSSWRRRYILGRELGNGQTATVFEAYATAPPADESDESGYMRSPRADELSGPWPSGDTGGTLPSRASGVGRRVALKRFHQEGTNMFKQELKALLAVGIHPHIVRLLESFETPGEDDVIILEHCNGGDVYELYASTKGSPMQESFVRQLIRQLLLALQHVQERCVEHRDVKPENLLLFTVSANGKEEPFLKLADFGWAAIVNKTEPAPAIPPEGVGSLWYAPPELNPPVKGAEIFVDELQLGKSDMWSAGIITYLLLTGHSPFNAALRVKNPAAREAEVIRLAALGDVNTSTRVWNSISENGKKFILALIRPDPTKRLSPTEALSHPFMAAASLDDQLGGGKQLQVPTPIGENALGLWSSLDSFQKLCWLALARAVTESELVEISLLEAFVRSEECNNSGYLEGLAVKLVSVASAAWFQPRAAWGDMVYLAFLYLDKDADGSLSASDLIAHLASGSRSRDIADTWIYKWRNRQSLPVGGSQSLTFADFRKALFTAVTKGGPASDSVATAVVVNDSKGEVMVQNRMAAIDLVCQQFLEEELENMHAGL
eukprot:TRINITY_DN31320_c0_g1_i1.p1 TRINITY_DN31320_c0_g1~~TRINITY_DN31320_c0_g1_i1.p1  ORF type:complete len:635 (+),score=103.19 TRINITY_DN31320_c0_g1_i1:104-2008(+)